MLILKLRVYQQLKLSNYKVNLYLEFSRLIKLRVTEYIIYKIYIIYIKYTKSYYRYYSLISRLEVKIYNHETTVKQRMR